MTDDAKFKEFDTLIADFFSAAKMNSEDPNLNYEPLVELVVIVKRNTKDEYYKSMCVELLRQLKENYGYDIDSIEARVNSLKWLLE